MKKGRTTANLEEGELEEDETISIGMVHAGLHGRWAGRIVNGHL